MLDRRLLMAQAKTEPPGGGIVTDGLVFRLNGLNQGGVPGHWIDEVGGVDFTLNDAKAFTNGIQLRDGAVPVATEYPVEFNNLDSTFQMVIEDIGGNKYFKLFDQQTYGSTITNLWRIGASPQWWSFNANTDSNLMDNYAKTKTTGSFSFSRSSGWMNLSPMAKGSPDYWPGKRIHEIRIGQSLTGADSCTGAVHEIRIYDRILTEPEILQNQQYDIDTYFGGVTPV